MRALVLLGLILAVTVLPAAVSHDPRSQDLGRTYLPASMSQRPPLPQIEEQARRALSAIGVAEAAVTLTSPHATVRLPKPLEQPSEMLAFLNQQPGALSRWRGTDDPKVIEADITRQRHPLGTDRLGRDQLARLVHGARTTALFAGLVTLFVLALGAFLGTAAAFGPRWADHTIMRGLEMLYALPPYIVVALGILYFGPSVLALALLVALVELQDAVRVCRGAALGLKSEPFVQAARALGQSPLRLIRTHILPNMAVVLAPFAAVTFARAVTQESALSFLALGLQEPYISLGTFIADAAAQMDSRPLPLIAATVVLVGLVLSVFALANSLTRTGKPSYLG
ncbi:ABC transporter permease [Sulfitobacter sp. S190]|uniref:ABC transporter permease n=1 Tax=Sulfitobacter sp. S190 TaxID=2867022 RepID=UPI0021A4EC2B|nr:ABC transporter permease [Sulfitobacter sp. S190]